MSMTCIGRVDERPGARRRRFDGSGSSLGTSDAAVHEHPGAEHEARLVRGEEQGSRRDLLGRAEVAGQLALLDGLEARDRVVVALREIAIDERRVDRAGRSALTRIPCGA